jgi:hypothetical protein
MLEWQDKGMSGAAACPAQSPSHWSTQGDVGCRSLSRSEPFTLVHTGSQVRICFGACRRWVGIARLYLFVAVPHQRGVFFYFRSSEKSIV